MGVPTRPIENLRDDLKSELSIELRCLKAVCGEDKLPAAASQGFGLGLHHQAAADTTAPKAWRHPYLT
jgi:hypothetical protein